MTHNKQEIALWSREYVRSTMVSVENRAAEADAAVAEFRKRYPAEPAALDQADNAGAATLIDLLDDIAGDSAFSGLGQSMQSRIYAAIELLRKGRPAAPTPVWYDEPPRPGEYHVVGLPRACWVDENVVWYPEWDRDGERPRIREMSRDDRRVSPIVKPQEPTT